MATFMDNSHGHDENWWIDEFQIEDETAVAVKTSLGAWFQVTLADDEIVSVHFRWHEEFYNDHSWINLGKPYGIGNCTWIWGQQSRLLLHGKDLNYTYGHVYP